MDKIDHTLIAPYVKWNDFVITTFPAQNSKNKILKDRCELHIQLEQNGDLEPLLKQEYYTKDLAERIRNEELSVIFGIKELDGLKKEKEYLDSLIQLVEEAPFSQS